MNEEKKAVLLSKTFWLGLATAFAPLVPAVKPLIENNLDAALAIIGALIVAFRFITKKPIV